MATAATTTMSSALSDARSSRTQDRTERTHHGAERGRTRVSTPLVSVVLQTHDRPALLDDAVGSVVRQSMADWELVIVDDASNPAVDVGRWKEHRARVRVIRNDRSLGGAGSKAVGASHARGELVAFLDDDDLYAPDLLARAVDAFGQNPGVEVLFLGVHWFGRDADVAVREQDDSMARVMALARPAMLEHDIALFDERLFEGLLAAIPMAYQRVVVRRAALEKIGPHRADCLMWDCDWALRAALTSRCALLRAPLYLQRADGQEYHSRPGRERAQLESALEMTLRLHDHPPAGTSGRTLDLLRRAASRHAGGLAYLHAVHGPLGASLSAWWRSVRLQPGIASPRVPLAALAHAARRQFQPEAR